MNNISAGSWLLDQSGWGKLEETDSGVLCITSLEQPNGSFSRVKASA